MHILRTAYPSRELQKYVRVYAQRELDEVGLPFFEPISARLEPVLQFQFGDLLEIRYPNGNFRTAPRIVVLGSRTHPGLKMQLAGKYEATSILGRSVRRLWNELGEAITFAERVQVMQRFLIAYAVRVLSPTAVGTPISKITDR